MSGNLLSIAIEPIEPQFRWTTNLQIGLLTFLVCYIINFYSNRKNYPPGPFPLPLIGNAHLFLIPYLRGQHLYKKIYEWREQYGEVITVYAGTRPMVLVFDYALGLDAFKTQKDNFAAKKWPSITRIIFGESTGIDGSSDVILSDNTRAWEALRKLLHSAVRQFTTTDPLPELIIDVIDEATGVLLKETKPGQSFDPNEYFYLIVFNIIAKTSYGQRYAFDDPELRLMMQYNQEINKKFFFVVMGDILPVLRPILKLLEADTLKKATRLRHLLLSKFEHHMRTYKSEKTRDFCDMLIKARDEAVSESKDCAPYLTPKNLLLTYYDLFVAGTDTTRYSSMWAMLFLASFPDVQQKVRREIMDIIGDERPTHSHKEQCHYVQAFITETLRFRPVVPINIGHMAAVDARIGTHLILKNTPVNFVQEAYLHSPKFFDRPQEFRPERFIDPNGVYNGRVPGNYPFGVGRRACVGEKLAKTSLFFMLVRFIQRCGRYRFELEEPVSLDGDPYQQLGLVPSPYRLKLTEINDSAAH